MSTQEFSQWVVDGNLERSRMHSNKLTYTPGQSGYVNFEDIELSITQQETHIEITPHVESRSEIFPEDKRFIEPETPVPGFRHGRSGSSSGGIQESETPQLPINPFENPFGPVHGEDGEMMALSQIFKATQAPSSPNLPRHLPSSQRPSPALLRKYAPDVTSGIGQQRSSGMEELMEMIEEPTLSSPRGSAASVDSINRRKRSYGADDSSLAFDTSDGIDGGPVDNQITGETKRRRISGRKADSISDTPRQGSSKLTKNTRGNKLHKTAGLQPASKAILIENEINISEDETEHEDELDDDPINQNEDDSEGNKENRIVRQDPVPAPGSHIKRASRGLQNQFIPLSSSPAPTKQVTMHAMISASAVPNEQVAIADSQSSQKVKSRPEHNENRPQLGSSNDSRKVIPQSQTAKPASSLHIVSKIRKSASQQTISPPDSMISEDVQFVTARSPGHSQTVNGDGQNKLISPRSSPPILDHQHKPGIESNAITRDDQQDQRNSSEDVSDKTITIPEIEGLSSQPENRVHEVRITRSSSAVPETTYVTRHSNAHSTSFPARLGNPFSVAEEMEFSFTSHSQVAEDAPLEDRRLAVSFGANRANAAPRSPLRRSPRRPTTFSAIAGDSNTQEQDSLELDAIFTEEDQEIRDVLARMPGSGSSPLDPVRRRRQRKAPVLLDEVQADVLGSQSTETTPVPARVIQNIVSPPKIVLPDVQQDPKDQAAGTNNENPDPHAKEKSILDEPIAFMEHSVPHEQYGRKAKRRQVSQAKTNGEKTVQTFASTAPTLRTSKKSSVTIPDSKQKGKSKKSSKNIENPPASTSEDVSKASVRASRSGLSLGTQTPCPVLSDNTAMPTDVIMPNRIFAEFRGSPSGFFAATCLDCWKGEAELKYSIRFDDGTVDQLGQALIKRLELHIGDQIKLDRRQYKSNTFVVTGYGPVIDNAQIESEAFPITDIYGHATIHVKLEEDSKKKSTDIKELEVPITEVYFTRGMRSAFRDREYAHSSVHPKPLATPTDSRLPSSTASPLSRTRSNNKLNLPGHTLSDKISKIAAADQLNSRVDGVFKDVVFIFTNNPNIKQSTSDAIEREGGTILKGQKDIEDLFDTPEACVASDVQNNNGEPEANANGCNGVSIRSEYKETRLVVLIADTVCRTTKYYQALALGIPCVSSRWVIDCLQAHKLKSWRQYLLAAGESETLGTTVSQQLNFTHDEIDSCYVPLSTLIARREQWLQNASILLVGNGGGDCDKRLGAYTFFAWILGATDVTVSMDSEEAEQCLAGGEHQFDWICIDNEKEKSSAKDRKNKRADETSFIKLAKTSMANVKIIDTRHVTESLILGNLVDSKDM